MNAALAALRILRANPRPRQRLEIECEHSQGRVAFCWLRILDLPQSDREPELKTEREIRRLKGRLLDRGIYPPFVKYPGSPKHGYFRFVISSEHSAQQLQNLITALTHG